MVSEKGEMNIIWCVLYIHRRQCESSKKYYGCGHDEILLYIEEEDIDKNLNFLISPEINWCVWLSLEDFQNNWTFKFINNLDKTFLHIASKSS